MTRISTISEASPPRNLGLETARKAHIASAVTSQLQDTLATLSSSVVATDIPAPTKPKLPQLVLAEILESQTEFRTQQIEATMESVMLSTKRSSKTHQEVLGKKLEEADIHFEPTWWDWALDGLYTVAAAASIVVGGTLISTGAPPAVYAGVGLVGSGVATIGSLVWHHVGGDAYLSRGLGLALSGVSLTLLGSSYFLYAHLMPGIITTIVTSTYAVTTATNEVTRGWLEKLSQDIRVAIETFTHRLKMDEFFRTGELEKLQMHAKESLAVSKTLTSAAEQLNHATTAIVRA